MKTRVMIRTTQHTLPQVHVATVNSKVFERDGKNRSTLILLVASCALGILFTSQAHGDPVLFAFLDGTEFDNSAPVGTTMTRFDEIGNPITITSLDVKAPDYELNTTSGEFEWDGVTYLDATTDIHGASSGGIRIINPGDFPSSGAGTDNAGFNEGEYWTMEFDKPVVVELIDFSSVGTSSGEIIRVTVGNMTPIDWDQDDLTFGSDGIEDPFSQLEIPAGTDIRFEGVAGDWRLTEIHVTEVPEPSTTALFMLSVGLGFGFVRRRRRDE